MLGATIVAVTAAVTIPTTAAAAPRRPKAKPGGHVAHRQPGKEKAVAPRGKVAVFAFQGDDIAESIRAQVVRLLRTKGFDVTTSLRPVDSAAQFREMASTLNLAVYVDGEVSGDGDQERTKVHVRSGVTGLRVASATFASGRRRVGAEMGRTLWNQVGPAVSRACAVAAKPRKQERAPMRIEAGTPIDDQSSGIEQGT